MGVHKGNGGDALNYSLEFKGGTSTSVEFNEDMSIEELDEKVVPIIEEISKDTNVQTQKVQGSIRLFSSLQRWMFSQRRIKFQTGRGIWCRSGKRCSRNHQLYHQL